MDSLFLKEVLLLIPTQAPRLALRVGLELDWGLEGPFVRRGGELYGFWRSGGWGGVELRDKTFPDVYATEGVGIKERDLLWFRFWNTGTQTGGYTYSRVALLSRLAPKMKWAFSLYFHKI